MGGPESFGSDKDIGKTPKQTFVFGDEHEIDENNRDSPETYNSIGEDVDSVRERAEEKLKGKVELSKEISDKVKELAISYKNILGEDFTKPKVAVTDELLQKLIPKNDILRDRVKQNLPNTTEISPEKLLVSCIFETIILELEGEKALKANTFIDDVNIVDPEKVGNPVVKEKLKKKEAIFKFFSKLGLLEGEYDPKKEINIDLFLVNLNKKIGEGGITIDEFCRQYAEIRGISPVDVRVELDSLIESDKKLQQLVHLQKVVEEKNLDGKFLEAAENGTLDAFYLHYVTDFTYELGNIDKAIDEHELMLDGRAQAETTATEAKSLANEGREFTEYKVDRDEFINDTPELKTAPDFLKSMLRDRKNTKIFITQTGYTIKLPDGLDTELEIHEGKEPRIVLLPDSPNRKVQTVEDFNNIEETIEFSNTEDFVTELGIRGLFGEGENDRYKILRVIQVFRSGKTNLDQAHSDGNLFNKRQEGQEIKTMLRNVLNMPDGNFEITKELLKNGDMLDQNGMMKSAENLQNGKFGKLKEKYEGNREVDTKN
ncbi:MAG: hypothetical protein O3B47_03995 [bacterium]|nr:hypothetical protein [bacterium]